VTYALKDADAVHALDAVSLEIGAGEAVGILGESGSGKTTLANAIMRMLPANATCSGGEILIDDRDLLKLPETELRSIRGRAIAMIPQDPALCLNPVITVGCQILEVLRAHVPLPSKARNARVLELLMEAGFEHQTNCLPPISSAQRRAANESRSRRLCLADPLLLLQMNRPASWTRL
jgi:ABC-type glutathione transport system ATPase component